MNYVELNSTPRCPMLCVLYDFSQQTLIATLSCQCHIYYAHLFIHKIISFSFNKMHAVYYCRHKKTTYDINITIAKYAWLHRRIGWRTQVCRLKKCVELRLQLGMFFLCFHPTAVIKHCFFNGEVNLELNVVQSTQ